MPSYDFDRWQKSIDRKAGAWTELLPNGLYHMKVVEVQERTIADPVETYWCVTFETVGLTPICRVDDQRFTFNDDNASIGNLYDACNVSRTGVQACQVSDVLNMECMVELVQRTGPVNCMVTTGVLSKTR